MKLWMRLALCASLSACGPGSAPPGPVATPTPCNDTEEGTGFPSVLLRVGCDGRLEPGRADWTIAEGAVTLEFLPDDTGPKGAELVAAWPPLDEPPWLGHRVERFAVLAGGSIRVQFDGQVRDPARLFADPRLAGEVLSAGNADIRDAIDAGRTELVTRHDASIEYARSLGRRVERIASDRLYLVAFAGSAEGEGPAALAAAVGDDWVRRGATGARRLPTLEWEAVAAECGSGAPDTSRDILSAGSAGPSRPSVSYPEDDPAARQIAERVVSAGLPGGPLAATVAALAGSSTRMVVRPVPPGGERWSATEVAAVAGVFAGPAHPCSLYAEALGELAGWGGGSERVTGTVLLIGEAAAFAIEPGS